MSLSLRSAAELLHGAGLLREIITPSTWTMDPDDVPGCDDPLTSLTYDSRSITPGTMMCCKGRFRPEFLDGADARGLAAYVAETDLSARTAAPGLIVDDSRKALSLLASEFHGRPQDELTLIGITGTKGKTTTAWFTQAILNAASGGRCGLISSLANCVDGHTMTESTLTTPESLDAMRLMRRAVDNGMRYMVMEVSSQAYKVERVFGLTFDVGAFLNISPDHISPIEHPTFEDYLFCKRQIVRNCRRLVLGMDSDHAGLLLQDAAERGIHVDTFALHDPASGLNSPADTTIATTSDLDRYMPVVNGVTLPAMSLTMPGEANALDAAAAMSIAAAAGVAPNDPAMSAPSGIQVPGHMERDVSADGIIGYVDFAHNHISTSTLLDEVDRRFGDRNPRIILVTGSAGGKALDRREGIVTAALGRVESFIFTLDDPNFEDPQAIARQMLDHVTDPGASARIVIPREAAIEAAVAEARNHPDRLSIILVIGKGHETCNIINGARVPYDGDRVVLRRALGLDADGPGAGGAGGEGNDDEGDASEGNADEGDDDARGSTRS